jgi:hypothetical protein
MSFKSFQDAFCERYHCSSSGFERSLFWRCLYPHAVPLAYLIRLFRPDFFKADFLLIQYVASDLTVSEVNGDLDRFDYGNHVQRNWLRTGLRIRICSERVAALAKTLF